jgi:hypothetical protein
MCLSPRAIGPVNSLYGTKRKNDFHPNARMRGPDNDFLRAAGERRRRVIGGRAEKPVPGAIPGCGQRLHSSQDHRRRQWIAFSHLGPRKDRPGALERSGRQIMHRVRQMAERATELHAGRSGSRLVPRLNGQVQTDLTQTGSRGTWSGQSRPLFFGADPFATPQVGDIKILRYFAGFQSFEICRGMAKKLILEG